MLNHQTGAVCFLNKQVAEDALIRVEFDAKSIDGTPYLTVRRRFGGSKNAPPVELSDQWARHTVDVHLTHSTSHLLLSMVGDPDHAGYQEVRAGEVLIDNVRAVVVEDAATDKDEQGDADARARPAEHDVQAQAAGNLLHDAGFESLSAGEVPVDGDPWRVTRQEAAAYTHMQPGGGVAVATAPLLHLYAGACAATAVRYTVRERGRRLTLSIEPTGTRAGQAPLKLARETCTLRVELHDGQFHWQQEQDVHFLQDVPLAACGPRTLLPLHLFHFHHQGGRPGVFLQFADPLPAGATGPSVSMQRDWQDQRQPYTGPDTFRANWRKRYTAVLL
ncbi:MAG: hypothetical protein ACOC9P_01165 [bacterium]